MKRVIAMVTGLLGAGFVLAGAASAHVTVSAPGATSGGSDQIITFRVPTESATASTVKLQVKFPIDTPIASVLVAPHTGWTDTVQTVKLAKPIVTDDGDITDAVSEVTWQADAPADGIKPGQFDQFVVIAGQLPDTPSLTFPSIQTYSDGSVVSWIETTAPGSTAEPDHPAPTLSLVDPSGGILYANRPASSNTGPIVLSIIALVLAAAALGVAFASRVRRSAGSQGPTT